MKFVRFSPLVFVVLTPLLLLWRLVFAGEVLYWGVPLTQFYTWHQLVKEALLTGHLPLWDFYLGNGAPLLANHQSGVFYPPNLLYLALPVERAMGYLVILHLMLAALFADHWGRTIGLAPFGRAILALSYALGGALVARTQFLPMIYAAAWLPLLFSLAHRLRQRPAVQPAVWLGLAVGLQFLAGHAQWWFYSLAAVGLYYAILPVFPAGVNGPAESSPPLSPPRWGGRKEASPQRGEVWRREIPSRSLADRSQKPTRAIIKALLYLALAGLIGLGLAAIQFLPTAELAYYSQRSDGADYGFAMAYSMWPWRWLTLAIPNLFGSPASGDFEGYATYWEDATYLGILPLLFAASALLGWMRAAWRSIASRPGRGGGPGPRAGREERVALIPFLLVLAVLGGWLAMGQNTFLYPLVFRFVPGFGFFQAPARLLLWTGFALATLAGIGADRFRLSYPAQYSLRLTAAGGIAVLGTGLYFLRGDLLPYPSLPRAATEFGLWLSLGAVVLLLRGRDPGAADTRIARSPLPVPAWQWLALIVAAADLLRFGQPLTPAIDPVLYRRPIESAQFILNRGLEARLFTSEQYDYDVKYGRYFSFEDFGPGDPARWQGLRESLLPTFPAVAGLRSANNYDPLEVGRWRAWLDRVEAAPWPQRAPLLRLANVGYLLGSAPPDLAPIYEGPTPIYALPDPLPFAYVVSGVRPAADSAEALAMLAAPGFDPEREVVLEGASAAPPGARFHPAASVRTGANRLVIQTDAPDAGYLVISQTGYPGWRATVDGRAAPILPANGAFQAVPVPAGSHTVVLAYRPASFGIGAGLSLATLLGLAGLALARQRGVGKALLL